MIHFTIHNVKKVYVGAEYRLRDQLRERVHEVEFKCINIYINNAVKHQLLTYNRLHILHTETSYKCSEKSARISVNTKTSVDLFNARNI